MWAAGSQAELWTWATAASKPVVFYIPLPTLRRESGYQLHSSSFVFVNQLLLAAFVQSWAGKWTQASKLKTLIRSEKQKGLALR